MKDNNCIFCKIANGDIPSTTLYEDEDFRVILDLGPASYGHALILPKKHYRDVTELPKTLGGKVLPLGGKIGKAMMKGLDAQGFNLVQNNGSEAGQTVMHFHMHIIPRYAGGPDMVSWTPGSISPEDMEIVAKSVKAAL